jgi:hypothetical protein
MPTTILNDIPDKITAGDSIAWKKSLANYSAADGWTLSYALVKPGVQIKFDAGASGSDHLVDLAATTTAGWTDAGEYAFDAYVTKGTERYHVDFGLVEIRANLAAQSSGYTALPYCFAVRDAIVAVLEMRATESQTSIAVGGRQISEMSHGELMDALERAGRGCTIWKRRNRRDRGKPTGTKVKAVFTES